MTESKGRTTQTQKPSSTPIYDKCPKCRGTGFVIVEMLMSEYARRYRGDHIYGQRDFMTNVGVPCPQCSGGFVEKVETAKKFSGIPNTFYDKRLKSFDWNIYKDDSGNIINTATAQKIVKSFVENFDAWEKRNIGLYIVSETKGSGKTFLASCICNEIMYANAIRTRFIKASDILNISKSGNPNSRDEEERDPMKLIYECKFLVIDDLGQKNTGLTWLEDELFNILDTRMTNKRMTLITSNVPIGNLQFNERLTDRISKMCYTIRLPEVSVREIESMNDKKDLLTEVGLWKE